MLNEKKCARTFASEWAIFFDLISITLKYNIIDESLGPVDNCQTMQKEKKNTARTCSCRYTMHGVHVSIVKTPITWHLSKSIKMYASAIRMYEPPKAKERNRLHFGAFRQNQETAGFTPASHRSRLTLKTARNHLHCSLYICVYALCGQSGEAITTRIDGVVIVTLSRYCRFMPPLRFDRWNVYRLFARLVCVCDEFAVDSSSLVRPSFAQLCCDDFFHTQKMKGTS